MDSDRNEATNHGLSRRETGEKMVAFGVISVLAGGISLKLPDVPPFDDSEDDDGAEERSEEDDHTESTPEKDDRAEDEMEVGGCGSFEIQSNKEV